MSSEFLHCTLCPKKPNYSDVSHLLTHVGSKGHLANLHSTQVRSNQELDAAHQLAIYNQWFQEHGIAGLLSERMQQKEQKRIDKVANQARLSSTPGKIKPRVRKVGKTMQPLLSGPASEAPGPVLKRSASDIAANDSSFLTPRHSSYPALPSSPPDAESPLVEHDQSALPDLPLLIDEAEAKHSPGTPQLKGIKYPGMGLFDAASAEQARKRNQRKDSSVLKQLEHNATLVEPTEVVESAAGLVLKRRSMDDLENDSPVEGEEPIHKPTPKRRKAGTRAARVKKEAKKKDKKPKRRPGRPRKQLKTPTKSSSSPAPDTTEPVSRFSPTVDESREFKLTLRNMARNKKSTEFAIYQDSSPSFGGDGSSEMVPSYTHAGNRRPQLVYPPPAWQRPQPEAFDPFKLIRDRITHPRLGDVGQGKENVEPFGVGSQALVNPLFFQNGNNNVESTTAQSCNGFNTAVASVMDPFHDNDTFMPVRNPLMAAFERLKTPTKQEGFDYSGFGNNPFAVQYRQPLFAP